MSVSRSLLEHFCLVLLGSASPPRATLSQAKVVASGQGVPSAVPKPVSWFEPLAVPSATSNAEATVLAPNPAQALQRGVLVVVSTSSDPRRPLSTFHSGSNGEYC